MATRTIAVELEAAVAEAKGASAIMRKVANGDATTEVPTESGRVPSIARWFAKLNEMTGGALDDVKQDISLLSTALTNSFDTLSRTKMSVGDYGLGSTGVPAPSGNDMNAALPTGLYGWGGNFPGAPKANIGGEYLNLRGAATRACQIAASHDTDEVWFRRLSDDWKTWRSFVLAGDFGIGSGGNGIVALADANATIRSGKYLVYPTTANGPGVYGTLDMSYYDPTNWTQLVISTPDRTLYARSCINGNIQGWKRVDPELISNANGFAVKFSDGTMICAGALTGQLVTNLAIGSVFTSAESKLYFPVAFIAQPNVSLTAVNPVNFTCWATNGRILADSVNAVLYSPGATGTAQVSYIAMGRWK